MKSLLFGLLLVSSMQASVVYTLELDDQAGNPLVSFTGTTDNYIQPGKGVYFSQDGLSGGFLNSCSVPSDLGTCTQGYLNQINSSYIATGVATKLADGIFDYNIIPDQLLAANLYKNGVYENRFPASTLIPDIWTEKVTVEEAPSTPEPASVWLSFAGLAGVGVYGWGKRFSLFRVTSGSPSMSIWGDSWSRRFLAVEA